MSIIWGEQIGLRPFEDPISDAEAARVYAWSTDSELLRWSGGVPTELSFEEFRHRLRGDSAHLPNHRRAFFIVTRSANSAHPSELIGRIGIFAIDWDTLQGELGIVIGEPAQWNKGYGRAAVTLLLQTVFEQTPLTRINLLTFPENVRAQRCFTACGFRTIGVMRRFSPDLGEYDGVEMEIMRAEFLTRAQFNLGTQDKPK